MPGTPASDRRVSDDWRFHLPAKLNNTSLSGDSPPVKGARLRPCAIPGLAGASRCRFGFARHLHTRGVICLSKAPVFLSH